MTALLEQSAPATEKQHNKERLALLALLAALELRLQHAIRRDTAALLGYLLNLSDDNGVVTVANLYAAKAIIRQHMTGLSVELEGLIAAELNQTAILGWELADGEQGIELVNAHKAAMSVLTYGALGVPIADVIATALRQTSQNVKGAVTRAASAVRTVKSIAPEVKDELERKLYSKISSDAKLTLNVAFVEAFRSTANQQTEIAAYRWNLSPATDRHCATCAARDGREYDKSDLILEEVGRVHVHCLCFLTPVRNEP